jgi:hypothetical protein
LSSISFLISSSKRFCVSDDARSFAEGEIGGDDDRGALVDGRQGVSVNQHKADIERLEGQIQQLQAQVEVLSAKRVRDYLLVGATFAPIPGIGLPNADAGN